MGINPSDCQQFQGAEVQDLTIRLVEGTASAADKLLVPALVVRDQILGPIAVWCP